MWSIFGALVLMAALLYGRRWFWLAMERRGDAMLADAICEAMDREKHDNIPVFEEYVRRVDRNTLQDSHAHYSK
ncbi:MAG: hypothetical protein HQL53_02120 [Magnetococcales bacterium]|nr:hypothetical protein [Magnetococcales bacterium]